MATAKSTYLGSLRCENLHVQSGAEILTDAPTDNHGMGSAFSPTDLCALSLSTCILTTMAIYAQGKNVEILHAEAATTKHMASDPRRIAAIDVQIHVRLGEGVSDRSREALRRVAHTCPVARSLHPAIEQRVEITFLT